MHYLPLKRPYQVFLRKKTKKIRGPSRTSDHMNNDKSIELTNRT
ncbi:hypothetical protein [Rubritalea tangerina]